MRLLSISAVLAVLIFLVLHASLNSNAQSRTARQRATGRLLQHRAHVNTVSWLGQATALSMAEDEHHGAVVRLLRHWGARRGNR